MDWSNLLSSVVKYGPRQGWLLLIAGGVVVALDFYRPFPAAALPAPWPTIALVVAVVGASILLICAVEATRQKIADQQQSANENRRTTARINAYRAEALANLDVLDEEELQALVYILREGKQRFAGRLDYTSAAGLVNKCIVGKASMKSEEIWLVIDVVWEKRQELLQRYRHVPELARAPWDYGIY